MRSIDRREQVGESADGLRRAKQEKAVRVQRVVERRDHAFLQRRGEIDEQIAAADKIDSRERRVDRDVLLREKTEVAKCLVHAVSRVLPDEEAPQAVGGGLRDRES